MNKSIPLFENTLDYYQIIHEHSSLQFPLHVHSNIELLHVNQGEIEMQIGSSIFFITEGDFVVIFPNIIHSYHTLSDDNNTKLSIYNCSLSLLPLHELTLLNTTPFNPVCKSKQLGSDLAWVEHRLTLVDPLVNSSTFVSSLISIILCTCYPYLNLQKNTIELDNNLTENILSYICTHYYADLSLDFLSKRFGMSRFKLSRFFSNTIKTSFPDYVKRQRINAATFLLLNTKQNITDILFECGFSNQQSFNRAFKEFEGISPSEFRKKHSNAYLTNHYPLLLPTLLNDNNYTSSPKLHITYKYM